MLKNAIMAIRVIIIMSQYFRMIETAKSRIYIYKNRGKKRDKH